MAFVPKPMSRLEKGMQKHVAVAGEALDAPPETDEDVAWRRGRNKREWDLARADAVRSKDAKAVKTLDDEYAAGAGIDFPHTDDDSDFGFVPDAAGADFGFIPDAPKPFKVAPRVSQSDVRASEPPHTLAAQDADERGFNAAF